MAEERPVFTPEMAASFADRFPGEGIDKKLAVLAALRQLVTQHDVNVAREEYFVHLESSKDAVRRGDSLELLEAASKAADVCKNRFEYLSQALRAQTEEAYANEARELAKTNTKLAKSQTLIAGAVAIFTLVQVVLAIVQATRGK